MEEQDRAGRYDPGDTGVHEFICEVCGKTSQLTNQEAFDEGWDWPPFLGVAGTVSPRTCGDCPIDKTVWWAIAVDHLDTSDLSENQREAIKRILAEGS